MEIFVRLADKGSLHIEDFDAESALDLRESLESGEQWLTFDMDGATVLVNTAHVVRIDFETGGE